ncbi:MAG: 16S rRNA (guanine(527)-N(7))-methyltransferase RsmG [Roseiflexus castenholzii]|uniref:16S rRNA (guanine(527)-N(7))-methyltransferase RsmG n=1 Tax=Roseiflexus castenholzii TaxID=120962 RepID=UPI000CB0D7EA|nr:MAG: 16S rRNA (guanine(527)-N(7))-methyltransferase RsmG [Roseiflexus castenholzii]
MDELLRIATSWGLRLDQRQIEQFARYSAELRAWNMRVNLTSITDEREIVTRHFLDSLRCALSWGDTPSRLIDIGSGAGFPGLPLKILHPELHVTLVESVGKKAAFLQHIVAVLDLRDVTVVTARAEVVGRDPQHREQYDVVTARAVAELATLVEYGLPLCRIGGRFLAPKGSAIDDEVVRARIAIARLGGQVIGVEQVEIPGVELRTLVVIVKVAPTPAAYPRAVGIPAKRPIR